MAGRPHQEISRHPRKRVTGVQKIVCRSQEKTMSQSMPTSHLVMFRTLVITVGVSNSQPADTAHANKYFYLLRKITFFSRSTIHERLPGPCRPYSVPRPAVIRGFHQRPRTTRLAEDRILPGRNEPSHHTDPERRCECQDHRNPAGFPPDSDRPARPGQAVC